MEKWNYQMFFRNELPWIKPDRKNGLLSLRFRHIQGFLYLFQQAGFTCAPLTINPYCK